MHGVGRSWRHTWASSLRPSGRPEDDALDACAVLWSTERFAASRHRTLPETLDGDGVPERDAHGTVMRIVV